MSSNVVTELSELLGVDPIYEGPIYCRSQEIDAGLCMSEVVIYNQVKKTITGKHEFRAYGIGDLEESDELIRQARGSKENIAQVKEIAKKYNIETTLYAKNMGIPFHAL